MRELMQPQRAPARSDFVSVILTATDDLNAQFPAVGARAVGLDARAAALHPRARRPRGDGAVIRVLAHYYARGRPRPRATCTWARRRSCGPICTPLSEQSNETRDHDRHLRAQAARDPRLRRRRSGRQGARVDRRRGHRPARLERVALGPAPGGRRGDRARAPRRRTATRTRARACCAAGSPSASRSTRREIAVAQRLLRDPARGRLGALRAGRGARLRVAVVLASTRTSRRSRARARSGCRSPTGDVHDLDAIARRGHRGDPAGR